ncbi:MAG: hypothetical protein RL660_1649 [Bacteroidota bacterium]
MPVRKIINDPVHSFITIDDDLVMSVINHPIYQRLRRIKQMAMAYLVYPGAVHTRFQHSLGAYHVVCLALQELQEKNVDITPDEILGAKLAILLHDIGHGPFSHALEETLVHVHHEDISLLAMQKLNEEFNGQLSTAVAIFTGKHPKKFLQQLVSSQLDADRLDYLARDSFFTGVSEGIIGYSRIIKMLAVHNGELVVEEKGIHSIEKFLIARSLMYWQVYLHKTVLASETLLVKILERAKYLCNTGKDVFASPSLHYFLSNEVQLADVTNDKSIFQHFVNLDDADIFCAIKVWCNHSDTVLSDLSQRLVERRLFKTIFAQTQEALPIEATMAMLKDKLHIAEENLPYYFIQGSTSNTAYNRSDEPIKILFKDGDIKTITEIDNPLISSTVGNSVKKFYICHPI